MILMVWFILKVSIIFFIRRMKKVYWGMLIKLGGIIQQKILLHISNMNWQYFQIVSMIKMEHILVVL